MNSVFLERIATESILAQMTVLCTALLSIGTAPAPSQQMMIVGNQSDCEAIVRNNFTKQVPVGTRGDLDGDGVVGVLDFGPCSTLFPTQPPSAP